MTRILRVWVSFMIKINVEGRILSCEKGERLSEVLMRYGIELPHPCAGRGSCLKCKVLVDGEEKLSCQYIIERDVTVSLPERRGIEVEFFRDDADFGDGELFYALDIGTTTLALSLSAFDGREICRVNALNPQAVFGADVISRIEQCSKGGAASLQLPLIQRINEMTSAAGRRAGTMFAAGNATMLHLLLGVDCTSIGVAPYTPIFLDEREVKAAEIGLSGCERLRVLPSAHSFVGADVVAGLGLIDMPKDGKYSLFVDLGTNAEIALISEEKILCTAAAAGPCFEGSNIECGMSALTGAVCSVDIDESGISLNTVGGGKPRGICATGLIDTVYSLLKTGFIDDGGYMDGIFDLADGVYLSPRDVRNFQLAKSAVHSAIEALLALRGIGFDCVDALYISGGFAKKLSVERAAVVGIIPRRLLGKCRVLEDSCLKGTIKYALGESDPAYIADISEYCDLSADAVFAEKFIENMSFEI